ncbi:hypothetical protein ABPG75_002506 [Micractinium tetrahymenae]
MERRSRKGASRPSQNFYWDIVKGRADEEESSDDEEAVGPAEQPEAPPETTRPASHRRRSSVERPLESPIQHTLPGVDYVPDTPEDEGGLGSGAGAGADPGSGELLRHALRKSVEKARSAAVAAAAEGGARAATAAAGGAPPAPALTRDLTNQQHPAAPPALVLPPASMQQLAVPAGATPPVPQQHRRQAPPASFLAGAKAALEEASAGGARAQQQVAPGSAQRSPIAGVAELRGNGSALPAVLGAALAPRQQPTAAARARGTPQLALHRSPHEPGQASKRGAAQAADPPAAAATDSAADGAAAERTPQAQLGLRPVPGTEAVPPTGRTDGSGGVDRASGAAYMDPDFLDGIAMLERQHADGASGAPQPQPQLQPAGAGPAASIQQAHQHQQLAAPAAPGVVQPALRMPLSTEAPKSAWSDTPDSACLAALDQLEQQHAAGHLAGPADGAVPAGVAETPIPARQLTFTPNSAAGGAVPATAGPTPLTSSGGRRQPQLPTSHLGRSAMQLAEAALQQKQQAAPVMPPPPAVPVQDVQLAPTVTAQQQGPTELPAPAGGGFHHPLPPPQQQQAAEQQDSMAPAPVAGQKRMLAAARALEQIHAQHSPAAKRLQQAPGPPGQWQLEQGLAQPPAGPGEDGAEPASKRPRMQEQQEAGIATAAGPTTAPAAAAGPTAGPATDAPLPDAPPPSFDYRKHVAGISLDSEDEGSEDEEAERNLPLLSQYLQSGGKSPQQLRRQRGASTTPGTGDRSPAGWEAQQPGDGAADGQSPLGGQQSPAGPQASPIQSADPRMLETYLPQDLAATFCKATGITGQLYPWQADCLSQPGVLQGRNLVYCAPTSGGKSLVAEVLMLRRVLTTNRPAMVVLPFVSICSEKSEHLSKVLAAMGKEVKEFFGGNHSQAALTQTTGVIVCTIEKANMIITRMLEDQSLGLLSCLVVDELHMVGEEERGYQLELLLTKLRYAAAACDGEDDDYLSEGLQIIGMSATLPNVDKVSNWLNAELYQTEFRPVPLQSFLKQGTALKNDKLEVVRQLELPQGWDTSRSGDFDHTALLARETVQDGHSVLIFCGTKAACETTAKRAARMIEIPERELRGKGWLESQRPTRASLLEELQRVPGGADPTLLECMARGAAFHHAGLSSEERDIVEAGYRCGAVSVLCATSTLAAGVNLPARRVIIRHAYKGRPSNIIDGTSYRQMAGRAGRAGIDTYGECILVNQDIPPAVGERLFTAGAAPVASCLVAEKKGMKRALLEVVASGAVVEPADVERFIRCTLLSALNDYEKVKSDTIEALKWLGSREHCFIYWDDQSKTYQPTSFGKAVLASGLAPEICLVLKEDLARARQSFVMTTELHLTYLCVPITETIAQLDWKRFEAMLSTLTNAEASVATKVGVDRGFVMRMARGIRTGGAQDADKERICKRFWMALVLTDIIAEVDVASVMRKFGVGRGEIQNLQDKAARFASMAAAFCERVTWYDLEALIVKFQSRVLHGVRPEILALSEIPFVKAFTARLLYRAGLRTPEAVAAVENVEQIVSILSTSQAANSGAGGKMLVQQQALRILRGARELLNRRARELREQAEAAFKLVESADKAELAHGNAEAAGEGDAAEGMEAQGEAAGAEAAGAPPAGVAPQGDAAQQPAAAQQQAGAPAPPVQQPQKQAAGAGSGGQAPAQASGRGGPGSGHSVPSGGAESWRQRQQQRGDASSAEAAAAAGDDACSMDADEEGDDLLDAPPEEPTPPDPWQYGGKPGLHVLDTAEGVRQMCAILLPPPDHAAAQQAPQEGEQQAQQQAQQQRYSCFGFRFETAATGSAAGAAALLPKGPTAAQRRDNAAHDKQSEDVGVRLEGVAISWRSGQACFVPLHRRPDLVAELASLFACPCLEKATWDLRGQLAALAKLLGRGVLGVPGVETPADQLALRDPLVDVRVAAWLSTPDDKRLMDTNPLLAGSRQELLTLDSLLKVKAGQAVWAEATRGMQSAAAQHGQRRADAGRRAVQARKAWQLLRARLQADELLPPLWRTEMPLVRVIVDMEAAGVGVNEGILEGESPLLERRIAELEAMAHAAAGEPFCLSSPQEVSRILFEKLKLPPPPCAKELKSGGYSTGQEVLLELAEHAIARLIFEHRKLNTLLTRFVNGFKLHLANATAVRYPGDVVLKRIRGSINQTCADTGRLAMDEPNLQTVPKPRAYKVLLSQGDAAGDQASDGGHAMRTANLRSAFVVPPGMVLLSADYRQVEFRLMAHFSGDAALTRIFCDDSADPFRLMAAQWLRLPPEQVTQKQRDHAKQLTYGLLYGMGASKLADELGCTVAEAKQAQENFRRSLPGIEAWQAQVVKVCKDQGYVETLAGRRRYLPNINSKNSGKRAAAERQAKNTVCQGSAADLAKAAMVRIHSRLARELPQGAARLTLQIHDEVLLEVAEGALDTVARLVRDCMEGVAAEVALRVPLRVRLSRGLSWGELQEMRLAG